VQLFQKNVIGNGNFLKKKQDAKVHCNPKCRDFELQIAPKNSKELRLT